MIETLFAIFLVATAAAIMVATMPVANVSRAKASFEDRASGLAQKQLEAVKGLGYANANVSQLASVGLIDSSQQIAPNTYSFTNVDSTVLDNPSMVLPGGKGTLSLVQLQLNLVQIVVTVTWTDRGTTESFTTGTLLANL